jgi:hypothetical protein
VFGFLVGLFLNFWDMKNGWRLNGRKRKEAITSEETKPLIN